MKMGELWIYWQWMHILEWRYAHQYFWVRLAKKYFWVANHFRFFFKIQMDHLTQFTTNKSCYVNNI
jgi:hypothetical protein